MTTFIDVSIEEIVGMPLGAMVGLCVQTCPPKSPNDVLPIGDELQVIGINAGAVTAEMVNY